MIELLATILILGNPDQTATQTVQTHDTFISCHSHLMDLTDQIVENNEVSGNETDIDLSEWNKVVVSNPLGSITFECKE